jgi:hypothetical protein
MRALRRDFLTLQLLEAFIFQRSGELVQMMRVRFPLAQPSANS